MAELDQYTWIYACAFIFAFAAAFGIGMVLTSPVQNLSSRSQLVCIAMSYLLMLFSEDGVEKNIREPPHATSKLYFK